MPASHLQQINHFANLFIHVIHHGMHQTSMFLFDEGEPHTLKHSKNDFLYNQKQPQKSNDSPSASTPIFSAYILKRCQLKPRSFCS